MKILVFGLIFTFFSMTSFSEEFEKMCMNESRMTQEYAIFDCGKSSLPRSLSKLIEFSGELSLKGCKNYNRKVLMGRLDEKDLMVYDKKRESVRPLKCLCQEKIGGGLCSKKEDFNEKINSFTNAFQVKAWAVFSQDLFRRTNNKGSHCIDKVLDKINDNGCFEKINKIHDSSVKLSHNFDIPEKDRKIFNLVPFSKMIVGLKNSLSVGKGKEWESRSSYYKTQDITGFINDNKMQNSFFDLNSKDYQNKIKEKGFDKHIDEFTTILRSPNPEEEFTAKFDLGFDYFSLIEEVVGKAQEKRITLASHPDLGWLFTGISSFKTADGEKVRERFLNFSKIARENEFASLKELREIYEDKNVEDCSDLESQAIQICEMSEEHNISIMKNIISDQEAKNEETKDDKNKNDALKITDEDNREVKFKSEEIIEEIKCFQFPDNYEEPENSLTGLITRSIDPAIGIDRIQVPLIEAEVNRAIERVAGMEEIAEKIEKSKRDGSDPAKVKKLEKRFQSYLSGLKTPDGRSFNFGGGDVARGVAEYKKSVYDWADRAIDERVSEIQGETERIVKSDMPADEKSKKLKKLLDEVHNLNNGGFLDDVYNKKQNISEYISQYEDRKKDWENQYGEEARKNPSAVRPVVAPRSLGAAGAGNRGYQNFNAPAGLPTAASSGGSAADINSAAAYIPAAPSVPFAQGSLLTRVVPKEEFSNSTVKANLLARHKGYPIAVLDEKALTIELYTPNGTSYKLQETLTISEAEARGYVFPDDVKKLVAAYRKEKSSGRGPASIAKYEPKDKKLSESKEQLEKLRTFSDAMERQRIPIRSRVVKLNAILDLLKK